MKRLAINLVCSLLTFACGVLVASVWKSEKEPVRAQPKVHLTEPDLQPTKTELLAATIIAEPAREGVCGRTGLSYVTKEVHLKSERLRYEIDVTYPQIIGAENRHIRKLNRRIKQLVTEKYEWPLDPSKTDLRYYREKWPGVFNSVEINYEIRLATDSWFSIHFIAYSYGIGAAHSVQHSFVVNYDLGSGKDLRLADFFKPGTKYLKLISEYCKRELSKGPNAFVAESELAPIQENYESWNITAEGLRFNFDACSVFGCAAGEQKVVIPFSILDQRIKHKVLD